MDRFDLNHGVKLKISRLKYILITIYLSISIVIMVTIVGSSKVQPLRYLEIWQPWFCKHMTLFPHRGVPTQRTFRYPNPESTSRRKWQLRSANRYCALLFLFSRGHSSRLGLLSRATVMSAESSWCEAWALRSAGRRSSWQSTQNVLWSSGSERNSLNLNQEWEERLYPCSVPQYTCHRCTPHTLAQNLCLFHHSSVIFVPEQ